jgi:rare lipoprotein A
MKNVLEAGLFFASQLFKRISQIPREMVSLGVLMLFVFAAILVLAVKPVQAKLDSALSLLGRPSHGPLANGETPIATTAPGAASQMAVAATGGTVKQHHALEGIATWYGAVLNGHRTASGERFNMYDLTACHKTLPFGTIVRVIDQETGRSVKVRINDRGIMAEGRVIDLSFAAAAKLGIVRSGLTQVKIEIIKLGNGHHRWVHDAPEQRVAVQPPPPDYNGPMNIAQR